MKEYNFDLKIWSRLNEGGNIFKGPDKKPVTVRIDKDKIGPSLKFLQDIIPDVDLSAWLGTTGKKASSGDIDIGVDATKHDKKEVANHLKAWAKNKGLKPGEWVKLSGDNVHFKLPIAGADGQYAQVDLMFGNPEFQKWSMRGETGKYKGMHRHIIMASIAKAQGMKWSYKHGLVDRATNETISQDPKEIAAKLLPGGTVKDLSSVESILNFVYTKFKGQPEKIEALVGEAHETLSQHYGIELPMPNSEQVHESNDSDEYFLARLRDRIVVQDMSVLLHEAVVFEGGRPTQHIEDLIIFEGMDGLRRALEILRSYAENTGHSATTLKWDGSPALVFGRDEQGSFILTDVSGFQVKSYDGKARSADQLRQILTQRGKGNLDANRIQFINNMGDIFDEYQKATPKDFRGYLLGDLLWYNTPPLKDGHYIFKPNTVEYGVVADSDLGKRIGKSKTGIAIHKHFTGGHPLKPDKEFDVKKAIGQLQGDEVLAMPPAFPQQSPKINLSIVDKLAAFGKKNGASIEAMLNPAELKVKKISGLPGLLYKYINSTVGADAGELGKDFMQWLPSAKISAKQQENIKAHIAEHKAGFAALWTIIRGLSKAKNDLAHQLDQAQTVIKQNIDGNAGRGEGYVVQHPDGPVKLVPRNVFTATSKAKQR